MGTACLAKNFQFGTHSQFNAQERVLLVRLFKLSENSQILNTVQYSLTLCSIKHLLEGHLYIGA